MLPPIKFIIRLEQNILKEYSSIANDEISLFYQLYHIDMAL